jgi:hypothetical protein
MSQVWVFFFYIIPYYSFILVIMACISFIFPALAEYQP